jgi:cysteine rich repeat protein
MMAHEDKISSKCDHALYSAARNLDRAMDFVEEAADACWSDIEQHCANVSERAGRIAQCLVDNKSKVSAGCRSVLERVPPAK